MSAVGEIRAVQWRLAASWPSFAQWTALLLLSALISLLWGAAGLPASLLFGHMFGGIVFGVYGVHLVVPRWSYLGAQAVIGAMVSAGITPGIILMLGHASLQFGAVTSAILLGATALAWLVSRFGRIPGPTAIYGISPGAASAMVLLGEAGGADVPLVAFMQYSRVLLVALAAALVAHLWAGAQGDHVSSVSWLAPVHWGNLAALAILAALSQQAARLIRMQGWALLGPMMLLSALHAGGGLAIDLPRWLPAAAYAVLGLHIGLGFRRDALLHAGQALPVVVGSTLFLMGFCGLLAWGLTRLAGIDGLTAYLATSPGGIDTVAIIAASTPRVDLPFVLALQSVRLLVVIGLAPLISRWVVRYSPHLQRVSR